MKKFVVVYDETYQVEIEAKNADEAREKFLDGEYDNPKYLEIGGYDVIEVDDENA